MEIKKYFSKFLLATVIAMATLLPCSLTFGMEISSEEKCKYEETTEYCEELGKENDKKINELLNFCGEHQIFNYVETEDLKKALGNLAVNNRKETPSELTTEKAIKKITKHDEKTKEKLKTIMQKVFEKNDGLAEALKKHLAKNRGGGNRKWMRRGSIVAVLVLGTISYFVYKNYLKKKTVLPKKRWWSPSKIFNIFKWKRS